MKVLADFHHEHLYESLYLLFEKRLGWELYRPIGLEWYEQKYWKVYDHISTAQQFLSLNTGKACPPPIRNDNDTEDLRQTNFNSSMINEGLYEVETPVVLGRKYKAITLETFKNTKFDILVCSIPVHIDLYQDLINKYQPHAKLIFQAGNNWSAPSNVKNILTSSTVCKSSSKHSVFYHQEFDLDLFKPTAKSNPKSLYNMMHYLQESSTFMELKRLLPDWDVKCFGAGNPDGSRGPALQDISAAFGEMGFLWHVKREGDGYGYNIHHAAAAGVPLVVNKKYFKGMTAEPLLIDGVTCIDLSVRSIKDTAKLLIDASDSYEEWSARVHKRFKEVVDFDKEQEAIQDFLNKLQ